MSNQPQHELGRFPLNELITAVTTKLNSSSSYLEHDISETAADGESVDLGAVAHLLASFYCDAAKTLEVQTGGLCNITQPQQAKEEKKDLDIWTPNRPASVEVQRVELARWRSIGYPVCGRKIWIDHRLVGTCEEQHPASLHNPASALIVHQRAMGMRASSRRVTFGGHAPSTRIFPLEKMHSKAQEDVNKLIQLMGHATASGEQPLLALHKHTMQLDNLKDWSEWLKELEGKAYAWMNKEIHQRVEAETFEWVAANAIQTLGTMSHSEAPRFGTAHARLTSLLKTIKSARDSSVVKQEDAGHINKKRKHDDLQEAKRRRQ